MDYMRVYVVIGVTLYTTLVPVFYAFRLLRGGNCRLNTTFCEAICDGCCRDIIPGHRNKILGIQEANLKVVIFSFDFS